MQRQLAYDGHARRHPFRVQLRRVVVQQQKLRDDNDVRLFAMSFAAFFVCFYTFIV